ARPARERDPGQRLAALPARRRSAVRSRPGSKIRSGHVQDRHRSLASGERSRACLIDGRYRATVMIEKFAGAGRAVWSEFLDLNHTSKLMILVSLMIPKFAPQPRLEYR